MTVPFAPVAGTHFRVTFSGTDVRTVRGPNHAPIVLPLGISELGLPGVRTAPTPAQLPDRCLTDTLAVDGVPWPVRLTGSAADALDGRPMARAVLGRVDPSR